MRQRKSWSKNKTRQRKRIKGYGEKAGGAFTCRWGPMDLKLPLPGITSQKLNSLKSLMPRAEDGEEK